MENEITEVTRRAITDFLATSGISWCGRLQDDDFLARLYDLTKLPSNDHRYRNASQNTEHIEADYSVAAVGTSRVCGNVSCKSRSGRGALPFCNDASRKIRVISYV